MALLETRHGPRGVELSVGVGVCYGADVQREKDDAPNPLEKPHCDVVSWCLRKETYNPKTSR